jgi:hypothetical protein
MISIRIIRTGSIKGRPRTPSASAKAVETLRSRQIDLKERASAAKTAAWTKAVEKLRRKQAALAELIGNPTYADAILDRIVHNAHRINLTGHSLRRSRLNKVSKD